MFSTHQASKTMLCWGPNSGLDLRLLAIRALLHQPMGQKPGVFLSCSVATFFPFFLVAAPLKMVFPKKGPFFSRVTEQLSLKNRCPSLGEETWLQLHVSLFVWCVVCVICRDPFLDLLGVDLNPDVSLLGESTTPGFKFWGSPKTKPWSSVYHIVTTALGAPWVPHLRYAGAPSA